VQGARQLQAEGEPRGSGGPGAGGLLLQLRLCGGGCWGGGVGSGGWGVFNRFGLYAVLVVLMVVVVVVVVWVKVDDQVELRVVKAVQQSHQ